MVVTGSFFLQTYLSLGGGSVMVTTWGLVSQGWTGGGGGTVEISVYVKHTPVRAVWQVCTNSGNTWYI